MKNAIVCNQTASNETNTITTKDLTPITTKGLTLIITKDLIPITPPINNYKKSNPLNY